ncbi:MAG: SpoIIE family protein phosphatase [Gammaproteobacteria bacterium]|nr:SpoIIE family protein phosphatase [Gammaproteobacteria bacterium]
MLGSAEKPYDIHSGSPVAAEATAGKREQALILQHSHLQQELQLAAEFQQAVLPEAPGVSFLEVSVIYQPFAEVSGDVYDFLQNREGEQAIFLGDATGHGIAAALMTMMIHIGLEGIRRNMPTDESIRQLNKLIAARDTGRSVSAVFFRVSPCGKLAVSHAGHPSLIIIPADGSPLLQFEKGGCALGIFEDEPVPYEEELYQLRKGDKLFAYTDAVTEWSRQDKEIFGLERLLDCLSRYRRESLEDIGERLLKDLQNFSEGQPCKDDLTALIVEYTP